VQPTSHRHILPLTTAISPFSTNHTAPAAASATDNVMERAKMSNQPKSMPLSTTDGTISSSVVTMVSKGGITNSATNFTSPMTPATFTSMGGFSGVKENAAAGVTSTLLTSNLTVTYSTPSSAVLTSDNPSDSTTALVPTSVTLTSSVTNKDSPTPNLRPTQETTELNYNFSNPSTASSNSEHPNEEKTNRRGVIAGVIVGAILGSVLIGLVGYFIFGKKRFESFSHRRLYDDTTNDPVLQLDNALGPYDLSFGCASDEKTNPADRAEGDNAGSPPDSIPMADMTPPHLSP
ncbi:MUC15 protein, partial [Turnix velox]|nr:MUC15 protein [Turnix velox]